MVMFHRVKYHLFYIGAFGFRSLVSIEGSGPVVDEGAVVRLVGVVRAARGVGGEVDLVPLRVVVHVLKPLESGVLSVGERVRGQGNAANVLRKSDALRDDRSSMVGCSMVGNWRCVVGNWCRMVDRRMVNRRMVNRRCMVDRHMVDRLSVVDRLRMVDRHCMVDRRQMVDRRSVVSNHCSMVGKLCCVVPFLNLLWMFHGIAKLLDEGGVSLGNFVIEARMKHTVTREAGCDAGKDGKDGGAQMHSHCRSRDR